MTDSSIIFFSLFTLGIFLFLFLLFCFGIWQNRYQKNLSPYSGLPLRRGEDLPYQSVEKLWLFFKKIHQYDNQLFTIKRAAVCRETRRIFPNCVTWHDTIHLDWTFLQKRYPGEYVSWGSLTPAQQLMIRELHESLDGFQTEYSSKNASPRLVEPEYALAVPGPLYVDIHTYVLLGWKCVPGTDFEVLIVQKPKKVSNGIHSH